MELQEGDLLQHQSVSRSSASLLAFAPYLYLAAIAGLGEGVRCRRRLPRFSSRPLSSFEWHWHFRFSQQQQCQSPNFT